MSEKLPRFKTPEEFAAFVDTHDMAVYWDELEDVSDEFEFVPEHEQPRPQFTTVSFSLPVSALRQLEAIAAAEETDVSDLVCTWVAERLAQERRHHPELLQVPTSQETPTSEPAPEEAETPM